MRIEIMEIELKVATKSHASDICDLLNLAYRGETGWTTESKLVSGQRTNIQDVENSIDSTSSTFLVCYEVDLLLACICLDHESGLTYIGSFAVNPSQQNMGLGKRVLKSAERFSTINYKSQEFVMVVLSDRTELIGFYERQGYKKTGVKTQYPEHLDIGIPKINNLTVEQLRKYA